MNHDQMEQLNEQLVDLLPALRERLRARVGVELDRWLERGQSKKVIVCETTEPSYAPFIDEDTIQESASELYYLDMKGYDGFHPAKPLTPDDIESIRQHVKTIVADRVQASGLKGLIQEVASGYYDDRLDDKREAVFFIWAAMLEDDQPQQIADLWVLEHALGHLDYIFLLEDGASLNRSWRSCSDLLPPEVLHVLDLDYLSLEEEHVAA